MSWLYKLFGLKTKREKMAEKMEFLKRVFEISKKAYFEEEVGVAKKDGQVIDGMDFEKALHLSSFGEHARSLFPHAKMIAIKDKEFNVIYLDGDKFCYIKSPNELSYVETRMIAKKVMGWEES